MTDRSLERGAAPAAADGVLLQASFKVTSGVLQLQARVVNDGDAAIYIFDQLWTLDAASRMVADPQQIYRFARQDTLTLLWGAAPLPRATNVLYRNIPGISRLEAHASRDAVLCLALPVREHNVYFTPGAATVFADEAVHGVELVAQYFVADAAMQLQPSPLAPDAWLIKTPGAWEMARTVRSGVHRLALTVQRRTDAFERWDAPAPGR